jgi:hypothetical protein
MYRAIEQTADLLLLAEHDKRLNPGARLSDVRETDHQKVERRELLK